MPCAAAMLIFSEPAINSFLKPDIIRDGDDHCKACWPNVRSVRRLESACSRITVQTAESGASRGGGYALALRHLREPTAEDRPGAAAFEAYIAAESLAAKFRRRLTSKVRRAWRGTSPNTSRHAHTVRRDREATITS